MSADDIAAIAREIGGWRVEVDADAAAAIGAARRRAGRIVVAGSIFLIGPLRGILR
jgi:hypothetical protein